MRREGFELEVSKATVIIKEENGQKYVEIETESFSTFELNFYTPTSINNPQTLDNLTIYLIAVLVSSIMFITIGYVFKKRNNL